jgi:hypothetical protein
MSETLTGLAHVHFIQGQLEEAQSHIEKTISYLETDNALSEIELPFDVLLTCYKVLAANQDERAPNILDRAYQLLQAPAHNNISDKDLRRSFLENIKAHQEIVQLKRAASQSISS